MSGQQTGGLRERFRAVLASSDQADVLDLLLAVVQPELDAKDAQIERLAEEREQYQRAAKFFQALRLVLDTGQAPSEWAKPWRDRAEQAEDLLRVAHETSNTSEAARARAVERAEQAEAERDRLAHLVDEALTIRMYGEHAPGGNENWPDWDQKAEHERRGAKGFPGDQEAETTLQILRDRNRMREALKAIGTRCETSTGPSTCHDDPNRSPDGTDMMSRWCDRCIARAALEQPGQEQR